MDKFDIVVIGSGPAGRRAAIQAAKLGKSVLVVEDRLRLGGVSVHTGTIPSKTLRETVLNLSGWRERGFYGLAYRVKKDIEGKDLGARLRMTLDYEIEVLEHQFARNGVRTFGGMASFVDANHIVVTDPAGEKHRFGFEFAVIAVGTAPYRPANIPFNDHSVVDSDSLVTEPRVPRSLTVVGAGVIGIEYATIFSALDVPVTIIEPKDTILDFIDREIIEEFTHELRQRGVTLRLGAKVEKVEVDEQGWAVSILTDGRRIRTDMLLYAAGRSGATANLGLKTPVLPRSIAAASRSIRSPSRPACATSTPQAMSSAGPRWPPPRWNRAASRRCTPVVRPCRPHRSFSPTASMPCRKFPPSASPSRKCAPRASRMKTASPASARPRAAISWACSRA